MATTPEDTYRAFGAAKEAGAAEKLWSERCEHGDLICGVYRVRGRDVFVAAPARTKDGDGVPQWIPGRAWVGAPPPGPLLVGCKRHAAAAEIVEVRGLRLVRPAPA